MSGNLAPPSLPPFPTDYRASGLLLHITSLPSPYGIGDVGPVALAWIDRLCETSQTWWQALPLGPTGYGDSPYQSLSSFAGNDLLISPDSLIEDGLLREEDCGARTFSATTVDYDAVVPFKRQLVGTAWNRFRAGARSTCDLPTQSFATSRRTGWRTMFYSGHLKADTTAHITWIGRLSWSGATLAPSPALAWNLRMRLIKCAGHNSCCSVKAHASDFVPGPGAFA